MKIPIASLPRAASSKERPSQPTSYPRGSVVFATSRTALIASSDVKPLAGLARIVAEL